MFVMCKITTAHCTAMLWYYKYLSECRYVCNLFDLMRPQFIQYSLLDWSSLTSKCSEGALQWHPVLLELDTIIIIPLCMICNLILCNYVGLGCKTLLISLLPSSKPYLQVRVHNMHFLSACVVCRYSSYASGVPNYSQVVYNIYY